METYEDVYIVVAPSGTGKTTLNRRLISENGDQLAMSISYTTRPKRGGEIDGEHYHFTTQEEFLQMVDDGKMLEWAKVHNNYYGTPVSEIERIKSQGKKTILEIDIQGWINATEILPGAKSVFIMPPSIEAMWKRLEGRGTDSLKIRLIRLNSAKTELQGAGNCDTFIINDNIEDAYKTLKEFIINDIPPKLQRKEALLLVDEFLDTIENAEWLKKIREAHDQ